MEVLQCSLIILFLLSQVCADTPLSAQLKSNDLNGPNSKCNQYPENQFFWVDYDGKVPPNAITAGVKQNGSTIYIGQAYQFRDNEGIGIFPVEILEGQLVVYIAEGYRIYPQSFAIKILAGANDHVEWVDTSVDMPLDKIPNTLVRGGYKSYYRNTYEYIARIKSNGELFVGRAMLDTEDRKIKGLQMIYNRNNNYTIDFAGFQVLTVKKQFPSYVLLTGFND